MFYESVMLAKRKIIDLSDSCIRHDELISINND